MVEWLQHPSTELFLVDLVQAFTKCDISFGEHIIIQLATLQAKMLINSVH